MTTAPAWRGNSWGTSPVNVDPASNLGGTAVATGDWMVLALMYQAGTTLRTVTVPAGWTQIRDQLIVGASGTLAVGIYAKKRLAGETTYAMTQLASGNQAQYYLTWFSGCDDIANWVIGAFGDRAGSGGTTLVNIPSVTTTVKNTTVFALAVERSTADEVYTAFTLSNGMTKVGGHEKGAAEPVPILGYKILAAPGASGVTVHTSPNTHAYNGIGFHFAIPPVPDPAGTLASDTFAGQTGAPWAPQWVQAANSAGGVNTIQSNTARQVGDATTWHGQGMYLDGMTAAADMVINVDVTFSGLVEQYHGVGWGRTNAIFDVWNCIVNSGYTLVLGLTGGVLACWLEKADGTGSHFTAVGSVQVSAAPGSGTVWHVELSKYGKFVTGTVWKTGDAKPVVPTIYGEESAATLLSGTGKPMLMMDNGATAPITVTWDNLVVTAPVAPTGLVVKRWNMEEAVDAHAFIKSAWGYTTPAQVLRIDRGYPDAADFIAATTEKQCAHRGGSKDFQEFSRHAYTQSVLRGMRALEISLSKTSDGVWFGLHDATINRTSPSAPAAWDPATHTWAEVQAFSIDLAGLSSVQAPQPYMRLEQLLDDYGSTHVILIDPKNAIGSRAALLTIMNSYSQTVRDHLIAKFYCTGTSWAADARAAGYLTWGYYYQTDVAVLPTTQSYWDMLGMDYTADQPSWDAAKSYGKKVMAHTINTTANAVTARSKGADALQVAGVKDLRGF